jgi:hypothetical protein
MPLENKIWWSYIHEDLQDLLKQSFLLIETVERHESKLSEDKQRFHDYAFVVFPTAKAYEGFLKTLFLDLGFITDKQFYGKRFRVGKSLNPSLDRRLREKIGVYDRMVNFCGGNELADVLWKTWKEARNLLFHWFPNERNAIDFEEAKKKVNMVLDAMDLAFKECKIDKDA